MILTVDIGNTRIKCAQWRADIIVKRAATTYEMGESSVAFDELFSTIEKPSRVLVVCVAGDKMQVQFSEWVKLFWQLDVEQLQAQKQYNNMVNAYNNPRQHGVDRWAGVVAAHQACPDCSVCIIGAGTAITFDLVDKKSGHLGGYILPSYITMREAMLADTANVSSVLEEFGHSSDIPTNTSDAVNQGCHTLLQAGIREICNIAQNKMDGPLQIILTGGFAGVVLTYPNMPVMQHEPDLVMQGLYSIMKPHDSGVNE